MLMNTREEANRKSKKLEFSRCEMTRAVLDQSFISRIELQGGIYRKMILKFDLINQFLAVNRLSIDC